MKLFASLDRRDRKLLLICLASVVVLAVLTGIFGRDNNRDDNPLPSSYLTGKHGARAAYELLEASGYSVARWEQPLTDLASGADSKTVVILAEPVFQSTADFKAVDEIVRRGGRILVTGMAGGQLVPDGASQLSKQLQIASCKLVPEGLAPLAGSGDVWMDPAAGWKLSAPRYHVDYTCGGQPAVVEYSEGAGHVVWWASSTPLENGSISRDGDLAFFLNSLGAREGHQFYWDESLHGETTSSWFYVRGPALYLLLSGMALLGLLVLFSFTRRSGPVRDVPLPARASPIEFLEALGSLYAKAGASGTAVSLAYGQFRRRMGELCGLKGMQMSAEELSAALRRRFPQAGEELEADLAACEVAGMNDKLVPKRALALVQALVRHSAMLSAFAKAGRGR